jgi:penicillin-binding protein 1A
MTAYQMVHMLEGVVERGTGKAISVLGRPLAGKTGTSNDSKDTWFVGFSPDLAVGVFVGFDEPTSLGGHETGASTAAPIFRDFMREALKDKPAVPFRVPPGIHLVRVNAGNGRPTDSSDKNAIYEAFKPGTVPMGGEEEQVLDNDAGVMSLGYGSTTTLGNMGTTDDQPGNEAAAKPAVPASGSTPAPVETAPAVSAPVPPAAAPAPAVPQAGGIY